MAVGVIVAEQTPMQGKATVAEVEIVFGLGVAESFESKDSMTVLEEGRKLLTETFPFTVNRILNEPAATACLKVALIVMPGLLIVIVTSKTFTTTILNALITVRPVGIMTVTSSPCFNGVADSK